MLTYDLPGVFVGVLLHFLICLFVSNCFNFCCFWGVFNFCFFCGLSLFVLVWFGFWKVCACSFAFFVLYFCVVLCCFVLVVVVVGVAKDHRTTNQKDKKDKEKKQKLYFPGIWGILGERVGKSEAKQQLSFLSFSFLVFIWAESLLWITKRL